MEIHAMFISSMIGSAVGQEFVSETSRGIIGHIKSIWSHTDPNILEIMEKYDLKGRCKIIESIVNDINQQIEHNKLIPSNSLILALEQVKDIIDNISHIIEEIDQGIETHKTLWFNRWRTPKYFPKLKKLDIYQQNMSIRYDNLVRVFALNHHYNKNENNKNENNIKTLFNPKISKMTVDEHLEKENIKIKYDDDNQSVIITQNK
jgi:hypothetical protein